MDINQIKKDLYKSKNMAKFIHYSYGKLYYSVQLDDGVYQFPIKTVEDTKIDSGWFSDDKGKQFKKEIKSIKLSDDLGKTKFENEMRGSELIRWILMSIESEEFIKIR